MQDKLDWRKYIIVFLITLGLFGAASFLSNFFSDKKLSQLRAIQDEFAIDVLSSEVQFALAQDLACKNITSSIFSDELAELGEKLEWSEANLGETREVSNVKKYYSLLQIKDYLLMKNVSSRCKTKAAFVLYFYTTAENCSECERQSLVLSSLRSKYPELRVYSFDFSTDLSAVKAMLEIYKIEDTKLPAMVVDEELVTGFYGVEDLEEIILNSFKLKEVKSEGRDTRN